MSKAKILLVDDLEINITLLKVHLLEEGYEVISARNGKEALEMVNKHSPDIILLDIMMPIMDGYEVCSILKSQEITKNIPIIMVTALRGLKDKIRGIEVGADDFISKPFSEVELIAKLRSLLRIKKYYDTILEKNRFLQKELEMAQIVQQAILPKEPPDFSGFEFAFQYLPCFTLGGDFFSIQKLSETKLAVFTSDVMGHGVRSSLITMMLKTLFDSNVNKVNKTSDLLSKINKKLHHLLGDSIIYSTAVYFIIDAKKKQIYYSNAGHLPLIVFNSESGKIEELQCKGTILGILPEAEYTEKKYNLSENDFIFCYTDGLLEVINRAGEEFGEIRLKDFIKDNFEATPEEFSTKIIEEIDEFRGDIEIKDDINILCIKASSLR